MRIANIHERIQNQFEPLHDKTNKMTVRPAKTQFSLGLSESSLGAQAILLVLSWGGSFQICLKHETPPVYYHSMASNLL